MDARDSREARPSSRGAIEGFLAHKRLAIVGVSHKGTGFGNMARKELAARGFQLALVHPTVAAIDGQPCVRSLAAVAGDVDGVLLVTPPAQTERLVREAEAAGIRSVWMQQGAESEEAIRFCEEHGMDVVHHECVLMFTERPGFVHRAHRFLRGAFGHLPA